VERFEGVGRGVMGLLWLWKCVKNSKYPRIRAIRGAPAVIYSGHFDNPFVFIKFVPSTCSLLRLEWSSIAW
jgi:hypothetical protein